MRRFAGGYLKEDRFVTEHDLTDSKEEAGLMTPSPDRAIYHIRKRPPGEISLNMIGIGTAELRGLQVVVKTSPTTFQRLPKRWRTEQWKAIIEGEESLVTFQSSVSLLPPMRYGCFPAQWDHLTEGYGVFSFFPFGKLGRFSWACNYWVSEDSEMEYYSPSTTEPIGWIMGITERKYAILQYTRSSKHRELKTYGGYWYTGYSKDILPAGEQDWSGLWSSQKGYYGYWPTEVKATELPHLVLDYHGKYAILDTRAASKGDGRVHEWPPGDRYELYSGMTVSGGIELWDVSDSSKPKREATIWAERPPEFGPADEAEQLDLRERVLSVSIHGNHVALMTEREADVARWRFYIYNIKEGALQEVELEDLEGMTAPSLVDAPEGLYLRIPAWQGDALCIINANDGLLYVPLFHLTHEGVFGVGALKGKPRTQWARRLYCFELTPNNEGKLPLKGYVKGPDEWSEDIVFFNYKHAWVMCPDT